MEKIELHVLIFIVKSLSKHPWWKLFRQLWRSIQSETSFITLNNFRPSANSKNVQNVKHLITSLIKY